jgi:hypothetical protein
VRLSQPDRGNPFDLRFCTELSKIATVCDVDRRVRCVLIDADGRFFSVGGDLGSLGRDRDELQTFVKDATVGLHSATVPFARMDAPVVVAQPPEVAMRASGHVPGWRGSCVCAVQDSLLVPARRLAPEVVRLSPQIEVETGLVLAASACGRRIFIAASG